MDMIWGVVAIFVITIISMVLHEIAHGYVAYWLGDSTAKYSGRLSLNPLKHIDPVMTIIVPVVRYLTGGPIFDVLWGEICSIGVMVNLGFMLFNLLPIPPLDGSRFLYALAPEFVRRFMESIERYGTTLVFILILLFGSVFGSLIYAGRVWCIDMLYHMVGM